MSFGNRDQDSPVELKVLSISWLLLLLFESLVVCCHIFEKFSRVSFLTDPGSRWIDRGFVVQRAGHSRAQKLR